MPALLPSIASDLTAVQGVQYVAHADPRDIRSDQQHVGQPGPSRAVRNGGCCRSRHCNHRCVASHQLGNPLEDLARLRTPLTGVRLGRVYAATQLDSIRFGQSGVCPKMNPDLRRTSPVQPRRAVTPRATIPGARPARRGMVRRVGRSHEAGAPARFPAPRRAPRVRLP